MKAQSQIRDLLSGGDRRSIADSAKVRGLVEQRPARVKDLAALTADDDWLVAQRAVDLLEKLAHEHPDWIEPYKAVFIGPLAESDKWEIRLQIVRALPLFRWTPAQARSRRDSHRKRLVPADLRSGLGARQPRDPVHASAAPRASGDEAFGGVRAVA